MISLIETKNKNGTITLVAEYKPLQCKLEAIFYPERKELGTWVGNGDDWKEDLEPCNTLNLAHELLIKTMKSFMQIAEATL